MIVYTIILNIELTLDSSKRIILIENHEHRESWERKDTRVFGRYPNSHKFFYL